MIIPDTNLLVYAYDETCPEHPRARRWWETALSGAVPVGLPWVVILAFTRITTHPQICQNPLPVAEVRRLVTGWLGFNHVRVIQLSPRAHDVFFDLLEAAGFGGNLCTDALIALHAREHSGTVYSNDRDFDRFPGIRKVNPLK
jgi:toxin-antitoxin system PIN domain toxin